MAVAVKLGEALVQAGLIDKFQLQSALGQQRRWGGRLGKALIDLGFIDEATLIRFLSEKLKFSAVDLSRSKIAARTFQAVPKRVAEKYMAIPVVIRETGPKKTLVLAMAEPTDLKAIDEIEFLTNFRIEPVVALESSILNVLKHYGEEPTEQAGNGPISLENESDIKRIEVIHGDAAQTAAVQKEFEPPRPADEDSIPTIDQEKAEVQGEVEFDLRDRHIEEPVPEQTFTEPDERPLEMDAPEDSEYLGAPEEPSEEAEIIEDIEELEAQIEESQPPVEEAPPEPVAEESAPVAQAFDGDDEDSSNFATAETVESGDDFFATHDEASAEIESPPVEAEQIAEPAPEDAGEVAEAIEESEEFAEAEHVGEEIGEAAEVEAFGDDVAVAVAVDTEEAVAEAEEFSEAEEAVTEEAVYDEPIATAVEAEGYEAIAEAEPVQYEEDVADAEPVAEAEPIAEAEPVADVESVAGAEPSLSSLRSDITALQQKMEGFIMLFVLKEQGKMSLEEFLAEIRKI